MPTLRLYDQTALPLESRRVVAPGGYEHTQFIAHQDGWTIAADFLLGSPFDADYLRQYQRYIRRPTRFAPPAPNRFPTTSVRIYESDRLIKQIVQRASHDAAFSLTPPFPHVTWDADGLQLDLRFTARWDASAADDQYLSHPRPGGFHRWTIGLPAYDVAGSMRLNERNIEWRGTGSLGYRYGGEPLSLAVMHLLQGHILESSRLTTFMIFQPCGHNEHQHSRLLYHAPEGHREIAGQAYWLALDKKDARGGMYPSQIVLEGQMLKSSEIIDNAGPITRLIYRSADGSRALCEMISFRS